MEYSVIGNSDLRVSRICIGTGPIGVQNEGSMDELREMFDYAADAGINFVDTARNYGESEKVLGNLLKNRRDKFIIATKFSGREFDYETVKEEICTSLKNLRTDYADLYQIHWPKMKILGAKNDMSRGDYDCIVETMGRLKKEGLIRHAGISNFRAGHLNNFSGETLACLVSDQVPYSLLWRIYDVDGTAEFCKKHRINFLAYSPLAQGLLTGKFSRVDMKDGEDRVLFREPVFTAALRVIEKIRDIAEESEGTVAQVALKWLMGREIISSAITGVSKKGHLKQNVDSLDINLTHEQIRDMDRISLDFQEEYLVPGLEQSILGTETSELKKIGIRN